MRGNSGAELKFCGDYVVKQCSNAPEQCLWFRLAESRLQDDSVRLPYVEMLSSDTYKIEYIRGFSGTRSTSVQEFARLVNLVDHWGSKPAANTASWNSYLERLEEHVAVSNSSQMRESFRIVSTYELPSSFSHGDLTLENVLVENNGRLVLIDPNYSPDLFQSWVLDYGKLLQSVHADYHRVFNSSPGEDPAPLLNYLRQHLLSNGLWEVAIVAELSHIMRLRKYRPESERSTVDSILDWLIKEVRSATSGSVFKVTPKGTARPRYEL